MLVKITTAGVPAVVLFRPKFFGKRFEPAFPCPGRGASAGAQVRTRKREGGSGVLMYVLACVCARMYHSVSYDAVLDEWGKDG